MPGLWAPVIATERDGSARGGHESAHASGPVVLAPADDPVAFGDAVAGTGKAFVVVGVPEALGTQARAALTLTAARWPDLRIAWLISDHAPLALHAALNAARLTVDDPGLAPSFLQGFAALAWSGAWGSSVAGLGRPAPSVGQYLRSYLPGSHFTISLAPHAEITSGPAGVGEFARRDVKRVLLTDERGLPAAVAEQFVQHTGASSVRPYALPGEWDGVLRARGATQLALVPAEARSIPVTAVARCGACGVEIGSPVCPYCHVVGRRLDHARTPGAIRLPAEPHPAGTPQRRAERRAESRA